ncbi:hypothetical protein SUGI_1075900 [Cryptomeria japonica]|nr:hypothetical protein SUGI_1075900 [Cryptomeria japonica]
MTTVLRAQWSVPVNGIESGVDYFPGFTTISGVAYGADSGIAVGSGEELKKRCKEANPKAKGIAQVAGAAARLKWKWNLIVIRVTITCSGIIDDAFHLKVQKPQNHKSPSMQRLRNQLNIGRDCFLLIHVAKDGVDKWKSLSDEIGFKRRSNVLRKLLKEKGVLTEGCSDVHRHNCRSHNWVVHFAGFYLLSSPTVFRRSGGLGFFSECYFFLVEWINIKMK